MKPRTVDQLAVLQLKELAPEVYVIIMEVVDKALASPSDEAVCRAALAESERALNALRARRDAEAAAQ